MLASAFNALTRLHSRPALLKRLGTVDIFSPIRITPSNFFRFLRGPEYTTIAGKEFIIPVASILGQFAQTLIFEGVPTEGTFKIQFGMTPSGDLNFDDTAAEIQTALRLVAGQENVLVTGDFTVGFLITFAGFSTAPALGQLIDSDLDEDGAFSNTYVAWEGGIKKGDRIVEGSSVLAIDEIIEMPDLGGRTMGYRTRCD